MEPELAYGRHFGPAPGDARPAAVLMLLYPGSQQWEVPLTLRPKTLRRHSGQISLPGGIIEPDETSQQAALRELQEELGVPQEGIVLAGRLSSLYVFNSHAAVDVWVGIIDRKPHWSPSPDEVAEVLEVPWEHLADASQRGFHWQRRGAVMYRAPHYEWQGHHIWGATSMILAEFLDLMSTPTSRIAS